MKTLILRLLLCAVLSVSVLPITGFVLTGCGTVAEGSRKEVVRAEQFAKLSFAMADSFLAWELANQSIVAPNTHAFAVKLAKEFPPAHEVYWQSVKTYKSSPTPENRTKLNLARAVVQLFYDELIVLSPLEVQKQAGAKATSVNLK